MKLPENLRIDSIQGKAFVHLVLKKNGEIENIKWVLLSLKNKKNNCFIEYKEAINKSFEIKDYPLPLRPYVRLFKRKTKKLNFKRNESYKTQKLYITIPFEVY